MRNEVKKNLEIEKLQDSEHLQDLRDGALYWQEINKDNPLWETAYENLAIATHTLYLMEKHSNEKSAAL